MPEARVRALLARGARVAAGAAGGGADREAPGPQARAAGPLVRRLPGARRASPRRSSTRSRASATRPPRRSRRTSRASSGSSASRRRRRDYLADAHRGRSRRAARATRCRRARRGDSPHLRTRVEPGGMNYKGYNIAVHELGHNVEQVFSLYEVDHTLLAGRARTPPSPRRWRSSSRRGTSSCSGLAQARRASAERLRVLNDFWADLGDRRRGARRHRRVALDVRAPRRDARRAARGDGARSRASTWNRYYAPVLGREGHRRCSASTRT